MHPNALFPFKSGTFRDVKACSMTYFPYANFRSSPQSSRKVCLAAVSLAGERIEVEHNNDGSPRAAPQRARSRNVLINQGVIDRAVKAQAPRRNLPGSILVDAACPGLGWCLTPVAAAHGPMPTGHVVATTGRRLPQRTMTLAT